MSGLRPQPLATLLARALEELERERSIFDLPRRSFWREPAGRDLSIAIHGARAATPVGPAAGPHTQLAQNLALAWLAGARAIELKTIQVRDRLEIPRPCIDAATIGFNVEWSQELTLEESLEQYAAGAMLIHALASRGVTRGRPDERDTVFECSVGYDLEGIRSDAVTRFLDSLRDPGPVFERLRAALPEELRRSADLAPPVPLVDGITLSTFHGCPPEEIERIVEHLFERHALPVTVKLNPTLLGFDETESLLRGRLGFDEIHLDRRAFDEDLPLAQAVPMLERLERSAARRGLALGVKLTNTLIVRNDRGVLPGDVVYLSGPPLHPIAIALARRLSEATGGRLPMSFSAGIDADNVADAVACGFTPVTACTDLLKPTGYRRLPRYLKALEAAMEGAGASSVAELVLARAGADGASATDPGAVRAAARANLEAYAARVADDPRYHASRNREAPRREDTPLALFDCASCNACVVVCPNDAFFTIALGPVSEPAPDLVATARGVERRAARLEIARDLQWASFADFCNRCGNCETFCPETGGPQSAKPRFHGSLEAFEADAPADGFLVEDAGSRVTARIGGERLVVEERDGRVRARDSVIEAVLLPDGALESARVLAAGTGHVLRLATVRAVRMLRDAVLAGINPVSASRLPSARARAEDPAP